MSNALELCELRLLWKPLSPRLLKLVAEFLAGRLLAPPMNPPSCFLLLSFFCKLRLSLFTLLALSQVMRTSWWTFHVHMLSSTSWELGINMWARAWNLISNLGNESTCVNNMPSGSGAQAYLSITHLIALICFLFGLCICGYAYGYVYVPVNVYVYVCGG